MDLGLVATGDRHTSEAAVEVLRAGGNAFDAAVAAGFAGAVAEPCLTSLAGGGFLLARTAAGEEVLFDFFVAAPGLGPEGVPDPRDLVSVPIEFPNAIQTFHVGPASVGTPGALAGYQYVHERLGRLDLDRVVAPAVRLAEAGFEVDGLFEQLIVLLGALLGRTDEGRALFFDGDRRLCAGDRFSNPALGAVLRDVGCGRRRSLDADQLGAVTAADLAAYRVIEREPLRIRYRQAEILTNPPPSLGGPLVAHGLGHLYSVAPGPRDDPAWAVAVADALVSLSARRAELGAGSSRGTTHVAVVDAEGNVASMTTSNGSGSGEFAPGTGVQLNNVMGEDDLQPAGLGTAAPGSRIGSMMSPTVVVGADGRVAALGSGGSERIRSTITQLVVDLVDHGMSLADAVAAPRMHWDDRQLQVEPGFPPAVIDALAARWDLNLWAARDLYFGGAHGVAAPDEAVGDARRGGSGMVA